MATATYALEIDWDNNGTFDGGGEDVSDDLLSDGGATISRGFRRPLARIAMVTRATFVLDNSAKTYSPPSQATVLPRRQVKFSMTYSGTTKVLFRGFIESIRPTAGEKGERRVVMSCVDAMSLLNQHEGAIALQTAVYADTIVNLVVNNVYTPPATSYEAGKNLFPFSAERWRWEQSARTAKSGVSGQEQTRAAEKLEAVCASDWGRFFIGKDGTTRYYNRHHMPLDTTTKLTLDNTMLEMDYQKAVQTVFNHAEVTCYPRSVGEVNEVLGQISQRYAPAIQASSAETFVLKYRDPSNQSLRVGGKDPITPTTGDYEITNDPEGGGSDETANVTPSATFYADRAEVTLTNAAAYPVYVQKLQVRGLAVRAREPVTMKALDSTSITAYKRRKLPINAPLMSDPMDAKMLADHLVANYKDPLDQVTGVEISANKNATLMAAVRDLELMERVVLSEDQTGLSAWAGYIYYMEHRINGKYDHRLTFSLEQAYSVGTPFRLDTSQLDSNHHLLY